MRSPRSRGSGWRARQSLRRGGFQPLRRGARHEARELLPPAATNEVGKHPREIIALTHPGVSRFSVDELEFARDVGLGEELGKGAAREEEESHGIAVRSSLIPLRDIAGNADGRSSKLVSKAPIAIECR